MAKNIEWNTDEDSDDFEILDKTEPETFEFIGLYRKKNVTMKFGKLRFYVEFSRK